MGSVQASPFGSRQDAHLQEKGHSWKMFTPKGLLAPSHPFDVIHGWAWWAWSWGNGNAMKMGLPQHVSLGQLSVAFISCLTWKRESMCELCWIAKDLIGISHDFI